MGLGDYLNLLRRLPQGVGSRQMCVIDLLHEDGTIAETVAVSALAYRAVRFSAARRIRGGVAALRDTAETPPTPRWWQSSVWGWRWSHA